MRITHGAYAARVCPPTHGCPSWRGPPAYSHPPRRRVVSALQMLQPGRLAAPGRIPEDDPTGCLAAPGRIPENDPIAFDSKCLNDVIYSGLRVQYPAWNSEKLTLGRIEPFSNPTLRNKLPRGIPRAGAASSYGSSELLIAARKFISSLLF